MSTTYPLDRLGVLASNKVKNEIHQLHPVSQGEFNFIVPDAAPYFFSGLVVKYFTGDIPTTQAELEAIEATRLVHGVDYVLTHRADLPDGLTELAAYASISFMDITLEGNVILDYRTLGSTLTMDSRQITQLLAAKTVDPRSVYWSDVVIDIEFPPSDHLDDAETLFGLEAVIQQLRDIEIAITGGTNNSHYHEMTSINGLVDALSQTASNRGPNKYNVGPHFHFVTQSAPFEIVLPDFDSNVNVNMRIGFVGAGGYGTLTVHVNIDANSETAALIPDSQAFYEDDYLADQVQGHVVYRHLDGSVRVVVDMGHLENVMMFISGASINTPNARVYSEGWGINDVVTGLPVSISGDITILTGGGLRLDYAAAGEIKPNSCWMVNSKNGKYVRNLPSNAPDNSIIMIRDYGNNATTNNATVMGAIVIAAGDEVTGLRLDNNRGWFKMQFRKIDNKWHVVSGT